MAKLSHRAMILSMLALVASSGMAADPVTPAYTGRWTVSDDKPVFSARGIFYKTVDIARCGRDYCGVSVGKNGVCGPVLFRFLATSFKSGDALRGHGRWGNMRLNALIQTYTGPSDAPMLSIDLGNGYDIGERSGNMPKFSAAYRPVGAAHCVAR